ncbi:hypothetical protein BDR05DRAFT_952127 [Suillus weaverae]|nr:hypothetical protein BDR05DRAFT_952127 [Suillus weaverae]
MYYEKTSNSDAYIMAMSLENAEHIFQEYYLCIHGDAEYVPVKKGHASGIKVTWLLQELSDDEMDDNDTPAPSTPSAATSSINPQKPWLQDFNYSCSSVVVTCDEPNFMFTNLNICPAIMGLQSHKDSCYFSGGLKNPTPNVPAVMQDTEVPIIISAKQNDHLLKPPPCFACFIPLLTLPVSALVHSTTLPEFDPTLTELDICKFFSPVDCNISNIASSFLQNSILPLHLSSHLLDAFDEAVHNGVKSVCDPHFLGNLLCWALTYWHDQKWSLACSWLVHCGLGNSDIELATAINEISHMLQTLG